MWVAKNGASKLINDGTLPYWTALGWFPDADANGVVDETAASGTYETFGGAQAKADAALSTAIAAGAAFALVFGG